MSIDRWLDTSSPSLPLFHSWSASPVYVTMATKPSAGTHGQCARIPISAHRNLGMGTVMFSAIPRAAFMMDMTVFPPLTLGAQRSK